jgi:response regulator of citrate/malate metabolism
MVECVNPVALTRDAWPGTAHGAAAAIVEVEIVCTDVQEHHRRVRERASDVDGLVKPTWQEVLDREYEPWSRDRVLIDSARVPVQEAVDRVLAVMADRRSS